MASKRREHFRKTRKARMRELKQSPTGILAMVCALAAAAFFAMSVMMSYQKSGNGSHVTGSVCLIGLVFAVGSWILGSLCMKEENVRPVPPRTGIVLGLILTFVMGGMYIYGMIQ